MRTKGTVGVKLIECIDKYRNIYRVRYDITEEEDGISYEEYEFNHKPSLDEIKDVILDYYNSKIDDKILSGFSWNGMQVWLSKENQFNYKATFDLAMQTNGSNLPIVFKFGTTSEPIYYSFTTIEELNDFYTKAIAYINATLKTGWNEKDAIDWTLYNILN